MMMNLCISRPLSEFQPMAGMVMFPGKLPWHGWKMANKCQEISIRLGDSYREYSDRKTGCIPCRTGQPAGIVQQQQAGTDGANCSDIYLVVFKSAHISWLIPLRFPTGQPGGPLLKMQKKSESYS
ncbi:hypothetical protein [Aquitalea aquatilis]|uniref:hypothetical protein n=1 Tax=Aquitalea aquatilis TaxID=1537400 RepID=UPI0010BCF4C3|nr:hypothetical protein [Aquitalea aquatilis]